MSKGQNAELLFEDIAKFIAEGNALLEQGAIIELAGLDDHIRLLCDRVLEMTQDDRLRYADKLQFLLKDLRDLGEALSDQRDAVTKEIRDISKHRKASVAYHVADATDGYGKKDG